MKCCNSQGYGQTVDIRLGDLKESLGARSVHERGVLFIDWNYPEIFIIS